MNAGGRFPSRFQKFESWARDLAKNPAEMTVKGKGQAEKKAQDPAGRLYQARRALKKAQDRANHAASNAKEKQPENGGGSGCCGCCRAFFLGSFKVWKNVLQYVDRRNRTPLLPAANKTSMKPYNNEGVPVSVSS